MIIASCLDLRLIHILIMLLAATRSMMENKSRAIDERMEQIASKFDYISSNPARYSEQVSFKILEGFSKS